MCHSLHAAGIELAACYRHFDHARRESQKEAVTDAVQREREQLPGLRRVRPTPGTHTVQINLQQIKGVQGESQTQFTPRTHSNTV